MQTSPELAESLQGVKNQDVPINDATTPSLLDVANVYQNCGLLERCCKDFVHTLINEAVKSGVPCAGRILVPGDTIFKEGDFSGASLYIIYRGKVDVLLGETKVASLGSGSHFGEMQLLGLSKFRTATIMVSEFAQIFEITPSVFSKCIQEFPRERKLFESIASKRFAELQEARKKKAAEKGITDPRPQSASRRRGLSEGTGLVEPVEPDAQQSASEVRAMRQREKKMLRELDVIPAVSVAARRTATATPTCGMRHGRHDEFRQMIEEAEDPPDVTRLPPMNDLCLDQQRWLHGQLLQRAEAHANAEALDPSTPRSGMTAMTARTPKSFHNQGVSVPRSVTPTPGFQRADYVSVHQRQNQAGTPHVTNFTSKPRPTSASPAVQEVLSAVKAVRRNQLLRNHKPLRPVRPQTAPISSSRRSRPSSRTR
jgi:CRP-like cAMP-binding protein